MDRAQILGLLCQGSSVAAVSRRCGVGPEAVRALKTDGARAAVWYQDRALRKLNLKCLRIDALRSFGAPRRRKAQSAGPAGGHEIWTWTAIDPDTQLMVAWLVGNRNSEAAKFFMGEVALRLTYPATLRAEGDIGFPRGHSGRGRRWIRRGHSREALRRAGSRGSRHGAGVRG